MRTTTALFMAAAATTAHASYSLVDTYDRTNFFKSFDFYSDADPTHGFVEYVAAQSASSNSLAGYVNEMVYLGVDHTTASTPSGRRSTRVTSQKAYTKGLFVADIVHMPFGCGVWPALWTLGPNWPSGGEIDILEGVNTATTNAVTLHTSSGCSMSDSGSLSSSGYKSGATSVDCGANGGNEGCSISTASTQGYGAGFNANGGGVYAMEWTSDAIRAWFFPRGSSLIDQVTSNSTDSIDTSSFGTPVAQFTGCDIDANFNNHQIIVNTALCGDWAGNSWDSDSTCKAKADTCDSYVESNAADFTDAYWLINSIKVYQQAGSSKRDAEPEPLVPVSPAGLRPVPFIA